MSAARRRGLAAAALAALAAGGLALVLVDGDEDGVAPAMTTLEVAPDGSTWAGGLPPLEAERADDAPPLPDGAAPDDGDAAVVVGVALLDRAVLEGAALRFTSGPRRVEVSTSPFGVFSAALPPGDWTVEAPGLPDAGQVVVAAQAFTDTEALRTAMLDHRPRRGTATERAALRVVGPDGDPDDATRSGWVVVRPGDALLLRLASPWVVEAQVVDALTGAPLPGARAVAEGRQPMRRPLVVGRAGADGALRLVVPRTDSHWPTMTFEAPGYAAATAKMVVSTRVRVGLRRPLRLVGRVRDPEGRPLPASVVLATVRPPDVLLGGNGAARASRATCDAEGRFVIDGVPPGATGEGTGRAGPHAAMIDLEVVCPGQATRRLRDVLVIAGSEPLEVVLPTFVRQAGRVLGPDGQPVVGAAVLMGTSDPRYGPHLESDVTRADGRFVLPEVLPAPSALEVACKGFAMARVTVTPPVEPLVIRLERVGPPIQGQLLDARGEGVEGAEVEALFEEDDPADERAPTPVWRTERTGAAGAFSFGALPAGQAFVLRARGRGRDEAVARGVTGGATVTLRLPPEQDLVVRVEDDGRAEQARVTVLKPEGRLVLDDLARRQGGLLLATSNLRATGRLALIVRAPGFAPALRWFDAPPGETVSLTVPLEPGGGAVALAVRWPQGAAPTLRVAYRDPALGLRLEEGFSPPSVADLPLRLEGVGAGPVRLEVEARLYGRTWPLAPVDAVVRAGETTTVDLDLEAALRDAPPR
ncbi:MAG: carboxypeptidase-like regulatory domain-containing protein [Planctomycetes bacterium]|nr:carboxypeptidase-like regulatory domain-containing protein [Planctomycetota bacterium]